MTSPSPDTRIAEIRARLEAATAATDVVVLMAYDHGGGRLYVEEPERKLVADFYDQPDRDFYANAPADIAYLLAALGSIPDQIARAVEAEREACAKAAIDAMAHIGTASSYRPDVRIAAAIRARGVKP